MSLVALAVLAGCAGMPAPVEQMAVSRAAVSQAVSAGAPELAPVEMNLARDKMARAEKAVVAEDHANARMLAEQAQLDAQLAEAKAQAMNSRKAADALLEASRALREEMSRQAPQSTTTPRN